MNKSFYQAFALVLMLVVGLCSSSKLAFADVPRFSGGHAKYQLRGVQIPEESVLLGEVGNPMFDHNGEMRLKFDWQGAWLSLQADYQLISIQGDSVPLFDSLAGRALFSNPQISDDHRYFNLTHVLTEQDEGVLLHRLDRLSIDFISDRVVGRVGRQAISWGNGLIYTPMDILNPFDPAAVDKEYKTGDDMVYGQFSLANGDDWQGAWVARRDLSGSLTQAVTSTAAKYHGFVSELEYDLLIAEHYDDLILGLGGLLNVGGAIIRGDFTLTETPTQTVPSMVANFSYSWIAGGHNVSGILEYFYNGFGQRNGQYSQEDLAMNPDLLKRYARGELFTVGRQYVAASAVVEITPLWLLMPNVFFNISDHSAFVQLISSYDFKQNWQFLAALGVPIGSSGSEFGGVDAGVDGKTLATGPSLFMQLAWYF